MLPGVVVPVSVPIRPARRARIPTSVPRRALRTAHVVVVIGLGRLVHAGQVAYVLVLPGTVLPGNDGARVPAVDAPIGSVIGMVPMHVLVPGVGAVEDGVVLVRVVGLVPRAVVPAGAAPAQVQVGLGLGAVAGAVV